jgi:hypothetical protein
MPTITAPSILPTSVRRLRPLLMLPVLLLALLLPASALAKVHRQTCSAHGGAHAKAGSHRGRCPKHKSHALAKHSKKKGAKKGAGTPTTPALCEDESLPIRAQDGSFSCADGSQPGCENEATPVRSGRTLACPVSTPAPTTPECEANEEGAENFCFAGPAGSSEAVCEDGTAPSAVGGGLASCDDGSEPLCTDGSQPTLSESGQYVCQTGAALRRRTH